jgi:preprotein translocase subunit YajC
MPQKADAGKPEIAGARAIAFVRARPYRAADFAGWPARPKRVAPHDPTRGPSMDSAFAQFLPLILIFAIMYFLLIRPQQKKVKEHQAMVAGLRRGDQVITQGGLYGKVTKVKDDSEIEVEIAEGVKVRVARPTIAQVVSKTEPAEKA